jgi:hypothetical protein
MTWNVENLFRPGAPAAASTEQTYEAKLAGLAALISGKGPDVISLQEIGDPDALSDLIDAVGGSRHQRVSVHPDPRGIRVAWLAKPQITASSDVVDFPPSLPAVTADDSGFTTSGWSLWSGRGVASGEWAQRPAPYRVAALVTDENYGDVVVG